MNAAFHHLVPDFVCSNMAEVSAPLKQDMMSVQRGQQQFEGKHGMYETMNYSTICAGSLAKTRKRRHYIFDLASAPVVPDTTLGFRVLCHYHLQLVHAPFFGMRISDAALCSDSLGVSSGGCHERCEP